MSTIWLHLLWPIYKKRLVAKKSDKVREWLRGKELQLVKRTKVMSGKIWENGECQQIHVKPMAGWQELTAHCKRRTSKLTAIIMKLTGNWHWLDSKLTFEWRAERWVRERFRVRSQNASSSSSISCCGAFNCHPTGKRWDFIIWSCWRWWDAKGEWWELEWCSWRWRTVHFVRRRL